MFRVLGGSLQVIDGKRISTFSALKIYDQDKIYMNTRNPFKEITIRISLSTTTMKFASQHSDFYKSDRGIIGIFNQNLFQSVSHSKSLFWLYIREQIDTHMAYRNNDTGKKKNKQGIIILKKIERKTSLKMTFVGAFKLLAHDSILFNQTRQKLQLNIVE